MITSNTTIIILFLIVLIPLIFIKNSKFNESFTQKKAGKVGIAGNDSDCKGDEGKIKRHGGKMRDGKCYYEYGSKSSCGGIKWKKCDAERGDEKGERDNGRYVRKGNKMIFCRLNESSGSESDGTCESDWSEDEGVPKKSVSVPKKSISVPKKSISNSSAPVKCSPVNCALDGDLEELREQISFIQNSLIV